MRICLIAILITVVAGCSRVPRPESSSRRDWNSTLAEARQFVKGGDYRSADRLLTQYSERNSGSREGREILFWRALYRLDPNNKSGSLAAGISGLDAYIAADSTGWYVQEAGVLKRTAVVAEVQRLTTPSPASGPRLTTASPASGPRDPEARSREEEVIALRDELARKTTELETANAELERIKRRLANPRR